MSVSELAEVVGAAFTALAAMIALLTVRQGQKTLDAAQRPLLEVQVIAPPPDRYLRLAIVNSGAGIARGANFVAHAMGAMTENVIGDGFVRSGATVKVTTAIGPLPTPEGKMKHDLPDLAVMVTYRDEKGYVHYRTHDDREWVPRTRIRRRPIYPDRRVAWVHLYPNVSPDDRVLAPSTVEITPG